MKVLRNDLRELRDSRSLTQAEIADVLQVTPRAVGLWEHGKTIPNRRVREPYAKLLGLEKAADLFCAPSVELHKA